jgi:[ribosomal protein S5]-alanine N-acetyltransferase
MPEPCSVIHAPRLDLVPMTPQFMRAMHRADWTAASHLLGAEIPGEWRTGNWPWRQWLGTRAAEAEADATYLPWLPHVQLLRPDDGTTEPAVVGEVCFHGPPDETGRVEIGYSVVSAYRRRGFAEEAVRALTASAAREHGVTRFRAGIAPDNTPSLNLIRKLGFTRVGSYRHEALGEQLIFHRDGLPS